MNWVRLWACITVSTMLFLRIVSLGYMYVYCHIAAGMKVRGNYTWLCLRSISVFLDLLSKPRGEIPLFVSQYLSAVSWRSCILIVVVHCCAFQATESIFVVVGLVSESALYTTSIRFRSFINALKFFKIIEQSSSHDSLAFLTYSCSLCDCSRQQYPKFTVHYSSAIDIICEEMSSFFSIYRGINTCSEGIQAPWNVSDQVILRAVTRFSQI